MDTVYSEIRRPQQLPETRVFELDGFSMPGAWNPTRVVNEVTMSLVELIKPLIRVDVTLPQERGEPTRFTLSIDGLSGASISLSIPKLEAVTVETALATLRAAGDNVRVNVPGGELTPEARALLKRAGQI